MLSKIGVDFMQFWMFVLLIIIILSFLTILYVNIYNRLQFGKTKIEHVECLIDEDLRKKYDIIIRADDVIKNNLKTKKDYLKDYIVSKDEAISNFDFERKMKQAQNIIENLYNDNEELNENENMKQIMQDFKDIDEKLTAGISYYNKKMNVLNAYIRKFPNNIVAKIHKIKSKPYFDGKDMTDIEINDFKI